MATSDPEVTIQPLQAADVEAVCALARRVWREHYPPIIGSEQTEYMLAQRYAPRVVREEIESARIWWDTLRENGELVAFASSFAAQAPGEVKLDKLYVDTARQRRGYGRMLIDHTCERARRAGAATLILAVNKHNAKAIAAYMKHGFRIREAVVKDIGSGFVMDDYIMVRDCSP
jgi:ribosomal protein S18 acetylase RimI-like enzyme